MAEFLNVHRVFQSISDPTKVNGSEYRQVSVRMMPETYAALSVLCAQHGTTPSAFLRKCAEDLIVSKVPSAENEVAR